MCFWSPAEGYSSWPCTVQKQKHQGTRNTEMENTIDTRASNRIWVDTFLIPKVDLKSEQSVYGMISDGLFKMTTSAIWQVGNIFSLLKEQGWYSTVQTGMPVLLPEDTQSDGAQIGGTGPRLGQPTHPFLFSLHLDRWWNGPWNWLLIVFHSFVNRKQALSILYIHHVVELVIFNSTQRHFPWQLLF